HQRPERELGVQFTRGESRRRDVLSRLDVLERQRRRRQEPHLDRSVDAYRQAREPRRLAFEGRAVARPVDEMRPHQRRYQRQDDREAQSKQGRLHQGAPGASASAPPVVPGPPPPNGRTDSTVSQPRRRLYVGFAQVDQNATIFPGFMRSCGSSACLMVRMTSSAGQCSAARYFILPCPTPCSPVQVPSIASARVTKRSLNPLAAATSAGSSMSSSTET